MGIIDTSPSKICSKGKIIVGTKTKPNKLGVYSGKVEVNGVPKVANNGFSTFFPENLSAQEVVDTINEAYNNKKYLSGNSYVGLSDSGLEIYMYLDKDNKIISAFPQY